MKLDTITTGDARLLAERIPDGSIDLVFTDPVYDRIDDYRWLAETAARVLKPGGSVLACFGIGHLPETLEALGTTLRYRWTLGAFQPNGPSQRGAYRVFSKWWGLVWYDIGDGRPVEHFPDMVTSLGYSERFGVHHWRKNDRPFRGWIRAFTARGAIVYDPFTGGGTVPAVCKMLGRHYIASEIDPATAELARERVRNTQPPLFVDAPTQAVMELSA